MSLPPSHIPDTHSTEEGEEKIHLRRERGMLLLLALGMVGFGAACWYAYPHVTPMARQWLAHRHLPDLRQHLREKDWQQATTSLREARHWAPEDPEVLRACVEYLTAAGSADTRGILGLLRSLQQAGAATPEDLILMGKMYVRLGEIAKARELYEGLAPESRQQQHGLELQADLLTAAGRDAEAEAVRRQALQSHADDPESLRQLAVMDLGSPDLKRRRDMSEKLWQIARAGGPTSATAIEMLAALKALTVLEVDELSRLVEALPASAQGRETARFSVLSTRLKLRPHLRDEMIDQEIMRWKNSKPAQTAPLVTWLAAEREYDRILRLLPAPTAAHYTDLLPGYVEALRGKKKWQELNTLLTTGGIDAAFPRQRIRLWQVETQVHLRPDPDRTRQMLLRIFEEAGRGDDAAITLDAGALAEQLSYWDLAEKCYAAVAAKHARSRPALLPRLYQLAEYQHDGPGMLSASSRLLTYKPESTALLAQKLYLQLLLGIELELAGAQLHRLLQGTTAGAAAQSDHLHLLQALAAYREGQLQAVREPLSQVTKPEAFSAGERVVYAGLLKLTGGDTGKAFRLVERISPGLLLPEEKGFLQRAL
jgi:hypothetical protein